MPHPLSTSSQRFLARTRLQIELGPTYTLHTMELIISYLHQGFSAVVPFVVLLGLLIFVHELGHFLVAKFFGVRVEVFSLGFGKKILKYKKGDTLYCLSLIPLGGYVKMFGDELGAELPEDQKRYSFLHKPVLQRIGVVLAGPLMNFFFAILIFFIVALVGEELRSPIIGDVAPSSEAYRYGFRSGDTLVNIGGKEVRSWDEFQDFLNQTKGTEISVGVQRQLGGPPEMIKAKSVIKPNPNILSSESQIGEVDGLSFLSRQAVVGVRGGSFAAKVGLKSGDRIAAVNGHLVKHFRDLENLLIALSGQTINLDIERSNFEGSKVEKLKIDLINAKFSSLDGLGLDISDLYLAKIMDGTPAAEVGLKEGDHILKVNGVEAMVWDDVLSKVKAFSGEGSLTFEVERDGALRTFQITPKLTTQPTQQGGEEKRYTIGIIPTLAFSNPTVAVVKAKSIPEALSRGLSRTLDVTSMTVLSFLRLIQNKISPKNIGGVISIGQAASETYKSGITHFLQMMAVISINLFILNLLPIPVLDGGHLLFYTVEALRGAPLSMRKMEIAQQIGLALLMGLMVFALFNDFSRILGVW